MQLTHEQKTTYLRYADLPLPRHTSYPIVPFWSDQWGARDLADDLSRSAASKRDIALYIHIPFCRQLCFYCACNKVIVPDDKLAQDDPAEGFLRSLSNEIRHLSQIYKGNLVSRLHLGGGTPTFLTPDQMAELWRQVATGFTFSRNPELSLEIDPRVTTREQLTMLRSLGFNRVSLGVQDFEPQIQEAVGRVQPFSTVQRKMEEIRELGFKSVNFDLIYGLPWQTEATLERTLEKLIELHPDRIAYYRLAVIPETFKWQKAFKRANLPSGEQSLNLMAMVVNALTDAGYDFIGLDHFARPDDPLARAARERRLVRSFQGMSEGPFIDNIGLGPSSITELTTAYSQTEKSYGRWAERTAEGFVPARGIRLTDEDHIRRTLLQDLYCYGEINTQTFERETGRAFSRTFEKEVPRLEALENEGLLEKVEWGYRLTPVLGRLLVRVVAAALDAHLPDDAWQRGLATTQASKTG